MSVLNNEENISHAKILKRRKFVGRLEIHAIKVEHYRTSVLYHNNFHHFP